MRFEDAQVFLELAKQLNVRKAAERVGLSQSAVTKVLQRLEAEFGLKLAERGAAGILLTEAGCMLRQKAQAWSETYQDLRHDMAAAYSAQRGIVRVGTVPALLDVKLLPVLANWRRHHPGLLLQISSKISNELLEQVGQGLLDLAICFLPAPRSDLRVQSLGPQRYHIVAREGHPLVRSGGATMQALSKAEWLLPAPGVGMRLWVEEAFVACGLPLPATVVQTDTSTAQFSGLVRATDLITALMTPMFESPAGKGLAELPFEMERNAQPLVLVSRRTAYLSPAAVALRELLCQAFH